FAATATYDNADRLTNLTNIRSGVTLSSFGYTLDNVGNPTLAASLVNGTSESIHYSYNSDDRINQVCYDAAGTCTGTGLAGISFGYDNVGNMKSKTSFGTGGATTNYTYNAINELCWSAISSTNACNNPPGNATIYQYDLNGNQILA